MTSRTDHKRHGPRVGLALAGVVLLGLPGCTDSPTAATGLDGATLPPGSAITHRGSFHDVVHPGTGFAEIVEASDGTRSLRFRSFQTDPGPSLDVYLVAATDSTDSQSVIDAGYITLGALRSAEGDQSYPVPANLDLGVYRSVTVWCVPFELNFTTAPLTAVAGG